MHTPISESPRPSTRGRALRRAAALLALAWAGLPAAWAQAQPAGVIVGLKPGSATLREHPLADGIAAERVQRALQSRADRLGAGLGRPLRAGPALGRGVMLVQAEGLDATTLARRLAAHPDVAYAEPDGRKQRVAAPSDPLYAASSTESRSNGLALQPGPASGQWYLRAPDSTTPSGIGIEAAWARTRGSEGVVVAVLDTGTRYDHPDLASRLLPGYDMVAIPAVANDGNGRDPDANDPGDWVSGAEAGRSPFDGCDASGSSWHGTATASLVGAAADDALGMAGAAPGVRVLPVRVLGKCYGLDSDIIAGMRWAAGLRVEGLPLNPNPAKVLNLSLGGSGACSAGYQAAVDEVTAAGVLVVAAAGNSNGGPVNTPANCRGVLGVVALRHAGSKVGFSDMGPEIGIAAPGGNCINVRRGEPCLYPILAAANTGSQGPAASAWTSSYPGSVGTSFSSPLVAAVAGLVVSQRPDLTPQQIGSVLKATARPFPTSGADNGPGDATPVPSCRNIEAAGPSGQCYCTTDLCGAGMLDAGAAVAASEGALAILEVLTASPVPGTTVNLRATGSLPTAGASITAYEWRLVSADAGVVAGFSSATNASTASLQPSRAGSFTVELRITDSLGGSSTTRSTVAVGATPANPGGSTGSGGGGGGGASSGPWLLGLGLGVAVLLALRRREGRA